VGCAKWGRPVSGRATRGRTEEPFEDGQLAENFFGIVGADDEWTLGESERGEDEQGDEEKKGEGDHDHWMSSSIW